MTEQATVFMDHIRKNAGLYFDGFDSEQFEVQLEKKQTRPRSILYHFNVHNDANRHGIIVKVPQQPRTQPEKHDLVLHQKPELFPKVEADEIHTLGYNALQSMHEYFSNLGIEGLGAVRALDYLPEHQAIFTVVTRDPSLRQLFSKTSRLHFNANHRELELPLRNVGKWLRFFHEMPKEENVQVRHANRQEFIDAVYMLAEFLGTAFGNGKFLQKIASATKTSALAILPESLPIGLGHGDFAMRNILVGAGARITVIDTFAKWRTPIYEDIGYFLSALKLSAPQVMSQGLAFSSRQLSTYERAFLEGYFDHETIPYPAIRLYEMLSLLDKWSSVVEHYHRRGKKFKKLGTVKFMLTNMYFKKSANQLLKKII